MNENGRVCVERACASVSGSAESARAATHQKGEEMRLLATAVVAVLHRRLVAEPLPDRAKIAERQ